jgi:2-amino-4-hydroxy-6-hydroxymethyldihydropteridine diphosphokinase
METTQFVYLGIGTNLGDRTAHITSALNELARNGIQTKRCSSIYETAAWGFEATESFYNCVFECETSLSALQLLQQIKVIETALGRTKKTSEGYESRVIDIDILLYKNEVISTEELIVPHHYLTVRNFVLYPLAELIPLKSHPVTLISFVELLKKSPDKSPIRIVKPPISFGNLCNV